MRYVTFADRSGSSHFGVIEGDSIRSSSAVESFDDFVALDPGSRKKVLDGLDGRFALGDVTLKSPLHPRKNVFCVGRNYLEHAKEGERARGGSDETLKLPDVPTFFTKAPTSIVAPGQTIELDGSLSPQYDWEAELAIVIGERCRDVDEARALEVVFGYTCLNDVTARDLQRSHLQWFKGKSLDNSCPIGPWVVDAADIGDPQTLDIALRVNGVVKQHSNTANMIFSCAKIIASLSRGLTLEPGDVIASGTPEGVGFARVPPEFLKDGDVMEVELAKIGVLRTAVRIGVPAGVAR